VVEPVDSAPIQIDPTSARIDYEHLADALIGYYSRIDEAAQLLPGASVTPGLKFLWSLIKFEFAVFGDILLIPINIIIAIRNIFPGRWPYRSFCWKYLSIAIHWVWMGEYSVPFIPVRAVAVFLLHWHFRSRLIIIRRRVLLATGFSEDIAKVSLAKIDRALNFWEASSPKQVILTWGPLLISPAIELVRWLNPSSFPAWSVPLAILSFGYILSIPISAFVVKRGLMLGGSGREAYYPGFLLGPGYYAREREILGAMGLNRGEFPLDITLILASAFFTLMTYNEQVDFTKFVGWLGLDLPPQKPSLVGSILSVVGVVLISVVALTRRKQCGRS
jgi:hypothetical protein